MIRIGRLSLALPLFLLLAAGCNTSTTPASVSGTIKYKGETVPTGSLQFHTTEGSSKAMYNYAFKDGAYSGSDLPVGEYLVTIETESANPNPKPKPAQAGGKGKPDQQEDYKKRMMERGAFSGPTNAGPYVMIPDKYADEKTTTLKATLTKGSNTINFDLTD
jgi:hypothetical protein